MANGLITKFASQSIVIGTLYHEESSILTLSCEQSYLECQVCVRKEARLTAYMHKWRHKSQHKTQLLLRDSRSTKLSIKCYKRRAFISSRFVIEIF
jgi:hypothetical protein